MSEIFGHPWLADEQEIATNQELIAELRRRELANLFMPGREAAERQNITMQREHEH